MSEESFVERIRKILNIDVLEEQKKKVDDKEEKKEIPKEEEKKEVDEL